MKSPRVTNVSYNIQLKHIVSRVGAGVINVINILFVCFLIDNLIRVYLFGLIDYGEIIHACFKAFV